MVEDEASGRGSKKEAKEFKEETDNSKNEEAEDEMKKLHPSLSRCEAELKQLYNNHVAECTWLHAQTNGQLDMRLHPSPTTAAPVTTCRAAPVPPRRRRA